MSLEQRTRRSILIGLTAFVWMAVGAASVGRFKLSGPAAFVVNLATKPAGVKLSIDGEKYGDGNYVDTPAKLMMQPGKHKLKISRDGYIAHLVTIEGDPGDIYRMEEVVLQKQPGVQFAEADVSVGDKDMPIHVEIDDGLARGDTPLEVPDLIAGQSHTLMIYTKWPEKDGKVKCKFTPTGSGNEDELQVAHLKVLGKPPKIKVSGCDKTGKAPVVAVPKAR